MKKITTFPHRYLSSSVDRVVVRFEKDRLKEVLSSQDDSFHLEVIKGGKIGTSVDNHRNTRSLLSRALASSAFGDNVGFTYPDPEKPFKVQVHSRGVADLKPDDLVATGQSLVETIKFKSGNSEILVDVYLLKLVGLYHLQHSGGLFFDQKETLLSVSAVGELISEGDVLQIEGSSDWRDQTFDQGKFVDVIAEKFRLSKKLAEVPSGKMTVVFAPEAVATLLGPIETALSAKSLYKGVSKWVDKRDKLVVDSRFSLVDDPSIDFATGSACFDDEGSVAKPLALIQKGILKNFYTDLKHAEKLKIVPNGRGFGVPASPAVTNLVVESGKKPSAELIKSIKKGVLVYQILGGGQDSPYTGDFSISIHLGFLIDDGIIVGRVKNCLVSGNIFEMLKGNLGEISSDSQWIGGSAKLPFMQFSNVNVVSK